MSIKLDLIEFCKKNIEERIFTATAAIDEARKSSAGETKSSAGDKYETSREMMQSVIEQHTHQLVEAKKLKENLLMILDSKEKNARICGGSVVHTSSGNFFLLIPAGFIEMQGKKYALISLSSPIGKLLLGKSMGDMISFNTTEYRIIDVIN